MRAERRRREDYVTTTEYLNAVERRMKSILKQKL